MCFPLFKVFILLNLKKFPKVSSITKFIPWIYHDPHLITPAAPAGEAAARSLMEERGEEIKKKK